jgi:hypothetical protein
LGRASSRIRGNSRVVGIEPASLTYSIFVIVHAATPASERLVVFSKLQNVRRTAFADPSLIAQSILVQLPPTMPVEWAHICGDVA